MKEIKMITWCDHPQCQERKSSNLDGQETRDMEFWVYTPGKGRKPDPIRVEVCSDHEQELKGLYSSMVRFDMRKAEAS